MTVIVGVLVHLSLPVQLIFVRVVHHGSLSAFSDPGKLIFTRRLTVCGFWPRYNALERPKPHHHHDEACLSVPRLTRRKNNRQKAAKIEEYIKGPGLLTKFCNLLLPQLFKTGASIVCLTIPKENALFDCVCPSCDQIVAWNSGGFKAAKSSGLHLDMALLQEAPVAQQIHMGQVGQALAIRGKPLLHDSAYAYESATLPPRRATIGLSHDLSR